MSSLRSVGRSAAARNNDRASLCSFTFADGRVAVLRASPVIRSSALSMPANRRKPRPPKISVAMPGISSLAVISPLATSTPPWVASLLPSPMAI